MVDVGFTLEAEQLFTWRCLCVVIGSGRDAAMWHSNLAVEVHGMFVQCLICSSGFPGKLPQRGLQHWHVTRMGMNTLHEVIATWQALRWLNGSNCEMH